MAPVAYAGQPEALEECGLPALDPGLFPEKRAAGGG